MDIVGHTEDISQLASHALVIEVVCHHGGPNYLLICDNCPTNQGVYNRMGGPGNVYFESIGVHVYCVYDYVHIFKNLRNNWITVVNKELSFKMNGMSYITAWYDIQKLYEEDRKSTRS